MTLNRRKFLFGAGAWVGTAAACSMAGASIVDRQGVRRDGDDAAPPFDPDDWRSVRDQFAIADRPIDLSALYIASHPFPVRQAIEEHRRGLDLEPTLYLQRHNREGARAAIRAAGRFLGADSDDVALVDSTTMGLGLLYNGLRLRPTDELLTTEHDYYVTHESLRQAAERSGATVRRIPLYERIEDVTPEEIVERIAAAIGPRTRVLALTWVHSGTGLKLPMGDIAEAVGEANEDRDEEERVIVGLDGVHGLGVEDVTLEDLGCDFFAAGTHKWVFGPRGTGVLWGRGDAWRWLRPSIPSFLDDSLWAAWARGSDPAGRPNGERMTPGGFKPYEHRWAMAPAFEFLEAIGKDRVQERTHALARQLKEGLAEIPGIEVITPMDEELSAGIVCCDVEGRSPHAAVDQLRRREIVATVTPYAVEYLRFSPSIRNTPEEVETAIRAVHELA